MTRNRAPLSLPILVQSSTAFLTTTASWLPCVVSEWATTLTKLFDSSMTFGSVYVDSDIDLQLGQLSLWTVNMIGTLRAVASLTVASQSPCQSMPWPGISLSF